MPIRAFIPCDVLFTETLNMNCALFGIKVYHNYTPGRGKIVPRNLI